MLKILFLLAVIGKTAPESADIPHALKDCHDQLDLLSRGLSDKGFAGLKTIFDQIRAQDGNTRVMRFSSPPPPLQYYRDQLTPVVFNFLKDYLPSRGAALQPVNVLVLGQSIQALEFLPSDSKDRWTSALRKYPGIRFFYSPERMLSTSTPLPKYIPGVGIFLSHDFIQFGGRDDYLEQEVLRWKLDQAFQGQGKGDELLGAYKTTSEEADFCDLSHAVPFEYSREILLAELEIRIAEIRGLLNRYKHKVPDEKFIVEWRDRLHSAYWFAKYLTDTIPSQLQVALEHLNKNYFDLVNVSPLFTKADIPLGPEMKNSKPSGELSLSLYIKNGGDLAPKDKLIKEISRILKRYEDLNKELVGLRGGVFDPDTYR